MTHWQYTWDALRNFGAQRLDLAAMLLPYLLVGSGLLACLFLFVAIKREMSVAASRNRKRIEQIVNRLNEAHSRPPEPVIIAAPPRSGMNLTNRVQAMRMLRRNEDVSHIAAVLRVPRREVELLLHVQNVSAGK